MEPLPEYEIQHRILNGISNPEMLAALMKEWFQTPQGHAVLKAERAIASPVISRLFGYHILQLGCCEEYSLIEDSPVGHKIMFTPVWRPGARNAVANNEELPLASDSMDVVVVHHALDFTSDSHRLLREATRILRPGGQMLIIGFNPYSNWGFWKLFKHKSDIPWRGRFISKRRLSDWLQLLNLHIDSVDYGLHFPPVNYSRLLKRAQKIERLGRKIRSPLGGAYFLLCVKRVVSMTPIFPKWRPIRAGATAITVAENVRVRMH